MTPLVLAAAAALTAPGPALLDLRVTNGSTPYLGDGRLLTTVSPNRDGFRDAAFVHCCGCRSLPTSRDMRTA